MNVARKLMALWGLTMACLLVVILLLLNVIAGLIWLEAGLLVLVGLQMPLSIESVAGILLTSSIAFLIGHALVSGTWKRTNQWYLRMVRKYLVYPIF